MPENEIIGLHENNVNISGFVIIQVFIIFLGFALGSVEGRVAIQYVSPHNPKENFTFKCHRSNGAPGGFQEIYAV